MSYDPAGDDDIRGWTPPTVLPPGWDVVDRAKDGAMYANKMTKTSVIISCAVESDGKRWVHLSVAKPSRVPSWATLREVKEIFLGDVYAYQVMPPRSKYVNIHPFALHLFTCLDGGGGALPEFSRGTGSL